MSSQVLPIRNRPSAYFKEPTSPYDHSSKSRQPCTTSIRINPHGSPTLSQLFSGVENNKSPSVSKSASKMKDLSPKSGTTGTSDGSNRWSTRMIADMQKKAANKHKSDLDTLIKKYIPPALLTPHPSTHAKNLPTAPSLLDLEIRHALSTARLNVYLQHIISRKDRAAFLAEYNRFETVAFGGRSEVAQAMHELAVQELEKGQAAKKEALVRRREERLGRKIDGGEGYEDGGLRFDGVDVDVDVESVNVNQIENENDGSRVEVVPVPRGDEVDTPVADDHDDETGIA